LSGKTARNAPPVAVVATKSVAGAIFTFSPRRQVFALCAV
jgi:hypothetical protein